MSTVNCAAFIDIFANMCYYIIKIYLKGEITMADFVENLKKSAEKAFDSAETVTKAAIKKTSESVNVLKLKYSVRDIESDIKDIYTELGKMLYGEFCDGAEFTGEYREKCEKISEHYEEINILKTKIAEMTNKQICPKCGKYNDSDSRFCSSCGLEFENSDFETEE